MKKIVCLLFVASFILGITACEYVPPINQSVSNKEFVLAEKAYEDQVNKAGEFRKLKDSLCSVAEETYNLYLSAEISDEEIDAFISLFRKIDDLILDKDEMNIANKIINLHASREILADGIERFNNKEYSLAFSNFSNIASEDEYSEKKIYELIDTINVQDVKAELKTNLETAIKKAEFPSYMKDKYGFTKKVLGELEFNEYVNRINKAIETKSKNEPKQKELSNYDKKKICEYIQSRYDYYDSKEGKYCGDKYTDTIWKEVSEKYGLTESEIDIIWMNMYDY